MPIETSSDETSAMARETTSLNTLNRFLRGEISAVETYRQALEKIDDPDLRVPLDECLESHEWRAAMLRDRIVSMGGEPAEGSGAWGSFARLIETGASVLGIRAALSALEEGEEHGDHLYSEDIDELDVSDRAFVEREIMPAQVKTHAAISSLKHSLH